MSAFRYFIREKPKPSQASGPDSGDVNRFTCKLYTDQLMGNYGGCHGDPKKKNNRIEQYPKKSHCESSLKVKLLFNVIGCQYLDLDAIGKEILQTQNA
ncbi:hypothetical protein SDC9_181916 [bioreactor metagenome]|uniref:Uncharacterized protein n=1 Tax=bioreactor metagenome TaxID=1076179 RepID=A0A645HFH2_9ZZZZ